MYHGYVLQGGPQNIGWYNLDLDGKENPVLQISFFKKIS